MVSIVELMTDPALFGREFGGPSWAPWRAALRALEGLAPEGEADVALFRECTGREGWPTRPAREVYFGPGRRAGKGRVSSLIGVHAACFRSYDVAPGERPVVCVLASDRRQAQVVFGYIKGLLEHPMLRPLVVAERAEGLDLSNGVTIEVFAASFRGVRGHTIACAILDEVAFWSVEGSANPDEEIVAALRPALSTIPGSRLVALSTPYARRGVLWKAHARYFGKDADTLVWMAPSRVMNPTLDERIVADALAEDPAAARSEWLAKFRQDLESLLDLDAVTRCVVSGRSELPPFGGGRYLAFCDPSGGKSDSFTLCIAHREGGVAVVDVLHERKPPFSPADVVAEFVAVCRAYDVHRITSDRYGGAWVSEAFERAGLRHEPSALSKSDLYGALVGVVNSGRVELPDSPKLVSQLVSLERRTSRGTGRDSIDHPPGAHDDLANALAGAVHLCVGTHRRFAWGLKGLPWEWSAADRERAMMQERGELPPASRFLPPEWEQWRPWGRSTAEPGDAARAMRGPGERESGTFR